MSFFNDTNIGRVSKMCDMIAGPMTKSADSNKATSKDWMELLQPLIEFIKDVTCDTDECPPYPRTGDAIENKVKTPIGDVKAAIMDIPEHQIGTALFFLAQRVDDEIFEQKGIYK